MTGSEPFHRLTERRKHRLALMKAQLDRKFSASAYLLCATFSMVCVSARGANVVVPANQTNAPGNVPITLPAGAVRIQEIVGSGQFTTGAITIVALRLRASPGAGHFSLIASWQITMSTTQVYPN